MLTPELTVIIVMIETARKINKGRNRLDNI
jgi:hypothetical protein